MVWLFLLRRSKLSLAQNVNNKINAISHISIYLFPFITFFYNLYLLFLQTTNCSEVLWSRLETWSGIKSLSRVRVTWARINCLVLAVIRVDQFSHQQLKKKRRSQTPSKNSKWKLYNNNNNSKFNKYRNCSMSSKMNQFNKTITKKMKQMR